MYYYIYSEETRYKKMIQTKLTDFFDEKEDDSNE